MSELDDHTPEGEVAKESSGANLAEELSQIAADSYQAEAKASPKAEPATPEEGERLSSSKMDIAIDRERVAELDVPDSMKEWLSQLPPSLSIDNPVILIVGENGQGKSSFAKGIAEVVRRKEKSEQLGDKGFWSPLEESDPAFQIAGILTVTEHKAPDSKPTNTAEIEGSEIMFKSREWQKSQIQMAKRGEAAVDKYGGDTHRLSSRQVFEQSLETVRDLRVENQRWRYDGALLVFDEPEQGLSPDRQEELPSIVAGFLPESDIQFVPTNSYVLAKLTDEPRLDLRHPERGVFRPSDYGELMKVVAA